VPAQSTDSLKPSQHKSIKELIEEQFVSGGLKLPVFNPVALELRQALQAESTMSMKDIADLIMKDQSLASHLLRLANSSFYGGLKRVDTISAALVRLGMERVINLAMVTSQLLAHTSKVDSIAPHMSALWSRSFVCANGGRWLACETSYGDRAEEAFLAGLLHDIGELSLLKMLEKLSKDQSLSLALTDSLLHEVLETLHTDIGYRLMVKWQLPEVYALIARDHHAERFDEGDPLLIIIRLMDILCRKLGVGQAADPEIELAATPEAQMLGLKEIKLAELEVLMEDVMAESRTLLSA
jgi:HD-like signal output (HDOD) protein